MNLISSSKHLEDKASFIFFYAQHLKQWLVHRRPTKNISVNKYIHPQMNIGRRLRVGVGKCKDGFYFVVGIVVAFKITKFFEG